MRSSSTVAACLSSRLALMSLVVAALGSAARPARAQDTLTDLPVKLVGLREGTVFGKPCHFATVTALFGDAKYDVVVPNNDNEGDILDPVDSIMVPLKEAQPGNIFIISTTLLGNHQMFSACTLFEPKEGETDPGCYVLVRKKEKGNTVSVVLSKILVETTVQIPMAKNEAGKLAPNADLLLAVNEAGENVVVIVVLEKGALKSLRPYVAPSTGLFVKVTTAKVEDKKVPAIEIKEEGGAIKTLLLPKSDPAVANRAKAIKAGTPVRYRSEDEGEWTTVTEIWTAPK